MKKSMDCVRLWLGGCNGRMGRVVTACAATRCDCEVVAGIDINTASHAGFPVYARPANCPVEADAVIDFSHPDGVRELLATARERRMPAVIATTGLSAEQEALVHAAAADIPVFYSGNMSLGISLLSALARQAAAVLGAEFDVEIVEKHHNQKLDAPSGTALMLAKAVADAEPYTPEYVYDRHAVRRKRAKEEIGIHSVRGGTIVGEHEVIFAGHDEVVTLSHSAQSREVFAAGALAAALFVYTQKPGLYAMADVVKAAGK